MLSFLALPCCWPWWKTLGLRTLSYEKTSWGLAKRSPNVSPYFDAGLRRGDLIVPLNSTRQTTSGICESWSGYNDRDGVLEENVQSPFPGHKFPMHWDYWLLAAHSCTLLIRSPRQNGTLLRKMTPKYPDPWSQRLSDKRMSCMSQGMTTLWCHSAWGLSITCSRVLVPDSASREPDCREKHSMMRALEIISHKERLKYLV